MKVVRTGGRSIVWSDDGRTVEKRYDRRSWTFLGARHDAWETAIPPEDDAWFWRSALLLQALHLDMWVGRSGLHFQAAHERTRDELVERVLALRPGTARTGSASGRRA